MSEPSLKKQIMSGMVWKFAERFIAQGVSFIVSLVLARILMPEDYGVVAIINVFITVADVFLTSGLNTALIQKQDANELDFSTIFYCNLGLGVVLYIILFLLAPWMAAAYHMPILTSAVRVFALRLPISAYQSIQTAYVSRRMDFKRFFFSTIVGTLISAVVGIIMALRGYGVWALIAQYLTNTIIDTLFLAITVRWHPRLMFSWKAAKPLIKYGGKVMLTDLLGTVCNNLGDFIIGARYTSADLAYYTKGKQLPTLIKGNIYTSLISVLFPGMSKINDNDEKVKALSRKSIRVLTYIIYPLMTGLIVVAEPLTIFLYTEKWIAMVPFVWVVCIEAIFSVPGTITLQAVKAMGYSGKMLKAEIIKKPILIISIIFAMRYGVMAIAFTLPLNTLLEFGINGVMAKKTVGYSVIEQIYDCLPATIMSIVMGICVVMAGCIPVGTVALLFIQILVGVIVYLALSILTKNQEFKALCSLVNNSFKK